MRAIVSVCAIGDTPRVNVGDQVRCFVGRAGTADGVQDGGAEGRRQHVCLRTQAARATDVRGPAEGQPVPADMWLRRG